MAGVSVKTIVEATGIDRWFIYQIQDIVTVEKELSKHNMNSFPEDLLREAKKMGFGDEQICRIMKEDASEEVLYEKRKAWGITRVYKMVDTCSAEFEAKTPYYYSTFE
jgi:carbamoyl-phosphate synthase large subunit